MKRSVISSDSGGNAVLRTTLEQLSHRLIVRRRLPSPFEVARIYVSTEGGLRYLRPRMGGVDPSLLRLVAEEIHPGDVIWDIGANVGLFSFAAAVAAGPSGQVLAIEPDATLVSLLRRSAAANHGQAPVSVLPVAIADDLGVAQFHIARRNRATNHLDGFGSAEVSGIRATELVPTVTMDWLAARFPAPNLVKIDVEEAEIKVLAGGIDVLRAHPTVICEVVNRNAAAVRDLLCAHGYTLYDGEQPAAERTPVDVAHFNTLAISTQHR